MLLFINKFTMKQIALLLFFLVLSVSGFLIKVPYVPVSPIIPNVDWINRQRLILPLFDNVCDPSKDPTVIRLAQEFSVDTINGNFKDPNVLTALKNLIIENQLLPKGEIFTEYNSEHMEELRIISEILLGAQDFNTFLKAGAWARQNINCGLFVDAIYIAMMKRRDTEKLSPPAPYELLPNYFVKKDVVITGSALLTGTPITPSDNVRDDGNAYVIDANYTADIVDNDEATKLVYFHEDIGLNTYYFLKKLGKLPWYKRLETNDSMFGEMVFHEMKQLATRYDLERYSNGFAEVEPIDWDTPFVSYYDSMLIYSNGNDFGLRNADFNATVTEDIDLLKKIEDSITTVVNHMSESGMIKRQILNNLMEILVTGEKSYERTARQFIEKISVENIKGSPSALDHFMTSLRDPIFWKLNKKIVSLIDEALTGLPTYSRNELYFPGVEILNVDIKKMQTYFENFEFDATNALMDPESDSTFQVKISQPRLNHKPFAVKVNISSIVAQKGVMKIYIGPKMLPGELTIRKNEFMLLDSSEVTLKKGNNIFTRSSEEMKNLAVDFLSIRTLYKNVENAQFGLDTLPNENIERLVGFPSRMVIPKGSAEGLPFEIFVFVAPFIKLSLPETAVKTTEFNSALMSPGYPLDLTVENRQLFDLPNAFAKEFIVTHKDLSKTGSYDGSQKKYGSENSFDYSSKKGQYGKETSAPYSYISKKDMYPKSTETEQYKHLENSDYFPNIIENQNEHNDLKFYINDEKKMPLSSFIVDENKRTFIEATNKTPISQSIDENDVSVNSWIKTKSQSLDKSDKDDEINRDFVKKLKSPNPSSKSINKTNSKEISVNIDDQVSNSFSYSVDVNKNISNPWINTINKTGSKEVTVVADDGINKSVDVNINSLYPWARTIYKNYNENAINGINKSFSQSTDVHINNKLNPWSKAINKNSTKDVTFNSNDETQNSVSRTQDVKVNGVLHSLLKAFGKSGSKNINVDEKEDQVKKTIKKEDIKQIDGSSVYSSNIIFDDKVSKWSKTIDANDSQNPSKPSSRTFDMTKNKDITKDYSPEVEGDNKVNISIKSDKDKATIALNKENFHYNFDDTKLKQVKPTTKRRPSVYDYIVNGYYDDYYEEPKVYE